MQSSNIPAKKSLGQNFLKSKTALFKMVEAGEITESDTVIEVGPGKGALTEKLLEKGCKVIAIEKDHRLIELLQETFSKQISENKLEIIHDDVLNFQPNTYNLKPYTYKIIANIPYYITGQFLRKFLETDNQPERIVVMVQKEIAQRIIANDKKESLLSISVKAFGQPKMVMKVDKEHFSPQPKVDSAILAIKNINKELFVKNNISEEKFFEILHLGFAHKRKMLSGNLKVSKEFLTSLAIEPNTRAEDLTLEQWVSLTKKTS
jgi:16S rRNA (adenine1518-N6/adenine1519-N6)-dimethyltransferase